VTLDIAPLSGSIGAVIRGIDFTGPLSAEVIAAVRQALLRHRVVFFPGAHLDSRRHVEFAAKFGEVTPAHPLKPGIDGNPQVYEIDYGASNRGGRRGGGTGWHSDGSWVELPPMGTVLNAIVIPPSGGDTMWSNQVAAYEGLSKAMRDFLDGLTAVHDGTQVFGASVAARIASGEVDDETAKVLHPVEHPVVRTHPETGERSLYVNDTYTDHIKELESDESKALLALLQAHSTKPEYTVRYHWRAGDLGFWDNRVTQHSVVADYGTQRRVIQRATIVGDAPFH
jgi:taurine dioxygenase